MNCCPTPPGVNEMFDERIARSDARRYLRRGLDQRARRLLAAILADLGIDGATMLEVGGGAGGLSIELLRQGAARGTLIDASTAYVTAARDLAQRMHVADRLDVIHGNYAETQEAPVVDMIVMDRVICCYADWRALLENATRQAGRGIALTYPRANWWTTLIVRAVNAMLRLGRRTFRLQHHSPAALRQMLRTAGFEPRTAGHYFMWEIVVAGRA